MRRDKVNTRRLHPNSCARNPEPDANIRFSISFTYCRANFLLFYFSFRCRLQHLLLLRICHRVDVFFRMGNVLPLDVTLESGLRFGTHTRYPAPLSYIFMCRTMNLLRKWKNSAHGPWWCVFVCGENGDDEKTIRRWMGRRRRRQRIEWSAVEHVFRPNEWQFYLSALLYTTPSPRNRHHDYWTKPNARSKRSERLTLPM